MSYSNWKKFINKTDRVISTCIISCVVIIFTMCIILAQTDKNRMNTALIVANDWISDYVRNPDQFSYNSINSINCPTTREVVKTEIDYIKNNRLR